MSRLRFTLPLLIALLALTVAALPALAQDRGSISGKVSDKKTGHALPFANVSLPEAKLGALTDSEGQFFIGNVPAGTWEVKVQFLGYLPETRSGVVVTAGKTTTLDFQLQDVVVRQEKAVEVTAERRLVEVKQGATIRSVNANEIRNLPVQTVNEVLQQQAGISSDADQLHVRGGRTDETIFVVNGVTNRDLITGESTAGQLNARSVAEVNVATGAYDVRFGNALSGVVEVKLKEGGDKFSGGLTTTSGSYGGRSFQVVAGGPDRVWTPLLARMGIKLPGTVSSIVDVSGSLFETRFRYLDHSSRGFFGDLLDYSIAPPRTYHLRSSYEDSFFGYKFHYGDFFSPSQDNRWAARYGLTWKPGPYDKVTADFSKRIAIDQGFSRTFITATGDLGDPAYPWQWAHNIQHAPTIFEDNVTTSVEWRRTLSTTGYTNLQLSRYFYAQREDVMGKMWTDYVQPDDYVLADSVKRNDFFIDTGDDNTWQDRRSTSIGLKWSIVQRLKRHEIEVGLDHQFQTVQYLTISNPWAQDPSNLGDAHDLWRVHPWVGDLYVRDRIEYEGFTANIGLRADYWFLGREVERALADTANHNVSGTTRENFYSDTRSFFGRRYKMHVSPRVIVAHPITENSSFFFNYGQFTQNPSYRYVYSKLTSVSSEAFPLLGNPNLNPEVSVNYEVGAKHQFLPTAAINLTFFVKDVYDYPAATTFKRTQGASLVDVLVYLNGHFSRSKGFELELEKRRSNHWSGRLSYTFQQTKGKSSDPNQAKVVQENGGDASEQPLSETYVSWNRPHKITASFDLRYDDDAPFGWMRQAGINLYAIAQSGRAYTPINLFSTQAAEPYSKNGPFQTTVDVRLNRYFMVGGRKLDLGLNVTDIFDTHIVNRVDRVTGKGRVWGEGQYDPRYFPNLTDYTRVSQVDDPSNYGPGRRMRLSLDYDF